MSENVIEVNNLTRKFGKFTAVDRVSFQVNRRSIFGFLGPNGAGKSTTIRMLLGILPPSDGSGNILNLDIRTQPEKIRSLVGYMSQIFSLYQDLTVMENLDFFAGIFNLTGKEKRKRIDDLIQLARLTGYENQLAFNLPRGIRQRLSFAVSLVNDPEILFLDEPTAGVDPSLRRYFWDVIGKLIDSGKTVIVTSHYMDEVERCDNICLIFKGKIIARGSPEQLKKNYVKGNVYQCRSSRRLDVLEALKRMKGVRYPFPSGETVRFLIENEEQSVGDVKKWLEKSEIQGCEIEKVKPSLEDVFVYLTAPGKLEGEAA